MLILMAVESACAPKAQAPLSADAFIGEYVYFCADKGALHDPDKLTLHSDGTYVLVHIQNEKPGSTTEGTWRLLNEPTPSIQLDHAGFPVRINGGHIRLVIDDDLGQWYEKKE